MPLGGPNSERSLILTLRRRDVELALRLLNEAGFSAKACTDIHELMHELRSGTASLIMTDDVVDAPTAQRIGNWVKEQPAWSDLPIIVLTGKTDLPTRSQWAREIQQTLGNVTFLERPFHPTTLVSVARAALQSRRRQYEARELLERYELLARELQHRTKNMLAVIISIASASLRSGGGGHHALIERLHALAKAQDLIMEGEGHGTYLADLISSITSSFGNRVLATGPKVHLRSSLAQGFALIVHELATNAVKHGSLSSEIGKVEVVWSVGVTAERTALNFKWQEIGGPPARPPSRQGFGSLLLQRAVTSVGEGPRFDYLPAGFVYELTAELEYEAQKSTPLG